MRLYLRIRTACSVRHRREDCCTQCVWIVNTILTTVLSLILALPVAAELYRYRGPDGRLIISNSPPPAGSEVTDTAPEGSGPSTTTTAPTALKPVPSQRRNLKPSRLHDKPAKRKRRQRRARRQISRPVNTHKFGLLEIGSTKFAVERRLGPPAKRIKHGTKKRVILHNGQYISRSVRIESWHYPGNSRILPTRLVFYDDLLAEKDKAR